MRNGQDPGTTKDLGDIDYAGDPYWGSPTEREHLAIMKDTELDARWDWLEMGNPRDGLREINYGMCRVINSIINSRMPVHGYDADKFPVEKRWRQMQVEFTKWTRNRHWTNLLNFLQDDHTLFDLTMNSASKVNSDDIRDAIRVVQVQRDIRANDRKSGSKDNPHGVDNEVVELETPRRDFETSRNYQLVRDITNSIMAGLARAG
ncbi:hypothetical protein T484DRAFT_1757256 [Baffinella frigidus]|nr:hypothetical protein T484DRAFT_1757256 [Cryptophyta sp. CCMP2293]